MIGYFSDRESPPPDRVIQEISPSAWKGIVALVSRMIAKGAFGNEFPELCPDGGAVVGTDQKTMGMAIAGDIPDLHWPLDESEVPKTTDVLDLLEFCFHRVADPRRISHHSFFRHDHLDFDVVQGRHVYHRHVNTILRRNGMAYELQVVGTVRRILPPALADLVSTARIRTGDSELDGMVEAARAKLLTPDPDTRREALEKLWDAWERLKTLRSTDKRATIQAFIHRSTEVDVMRHVLDAEARALTDIGNRFQIRHWESDRARIDRPELVDYLYHRLFSLMFLFIRNMRGQE